MRVVENVDAHVANHPCPAAALAEEDQDYINYSQKHQEAEAEKSRIPDDVEPPALKSAEEVINLFAGAIDSMPPKVSKVSTTTRQELNPRRCFVELAVHSDHLNRDPFTKVNRYEDTKDIDAVELRNWVTRSGASFRRSERRGPELLVSLKAQRCPHDQSSRSPPRTLTAGDSFVYPGSTKNGPELEIGYERDAILAPTRLLYVCGALAIDLKSLVLWGARDPEKFKAHFLQVYGPDHPLAELPARDLFCAFVSTFEAVDIARKSASRGVSLYSHWLHDCTRGRPSLHIVGPHVAPRRWAKGANGWTGMIVAMAASDPELAAEAIFAAAQNKGYYFSCQVWWAASKASTSSNDDWPHNGRQAGLKLLGSLLVATRDSSCPRPHSTTSTSPT